MRSYIGHEGHLQIIEFEGLFMSDYFEHIVVEGLNLRDC